jgi:hypothetical protein
MKKKTKKKRVKSKDTKTYKLKELRRLTNKCLKLWSLVVTKRAGNICEIGRFTGTPCSEGYLNNHHMENYKLNKALRFAPENGLRACPGHHKYYVDSAHKSFAVVYQYMSEKRCNDMMYLVNHYKDRVAITKEFLEERIHELLCELDGVGQLDEKCT